MGQPTSAPTNIGKRGFEIKKLIGENAIGTINNSFVTSYAHMYSEEEKKMTGISNAFFYLNRGGICYTSFYSYDSMNYYDAVVDEFNSKPIDFQKIPDKNIWINERERYKAGILINDEKSGFTLFYQAI